MGLDLGWSGLCVTSVVRMRAGAFLFNCCSDDSLVIASMCNLEESREGKAKFGVYATVREEGMGRGVCRGTPSVSENSKLGMIFIEEVYQSRQGKLVSCVFQVISGISGEGVMAAGGV